MRKACLSCIRKHLAQAMVLMDEAVLGYPVHKWLAIGHMAEAESEALEKYPEFSIHIRQLRIAYEEGDSINLLPLIEYANTLEEDDNDD